MVNGLLVVMEEEQLKRMHHAKPSRSGNRTPCA